MGRLLSEHQPSFECTSIGLRVQGLNACPQTQLRAGGGLLYYGYVGALQKAPPPHSARPLSGDTEDTSTYELHVQGSFLVVSVGYPDSDYTALSVGFLAQHLLL